MQLIKQKILGRLKVWLEEEQGLVEQGDKCGWEKVREFFDADLNVIVENVGVNWEVFRKVKRWVGEMKERRVIKGWKEMREGIRGMRMLAVQDMVRGIVQLGDNFEVKEMMEVFHEVSEGYLGNIGGHLKNVREEVLKILGCIIHTHNIWGQKLRKLINQSVQSYLKITTISPPNLSIPTCLSLHQKLYLLSTHLHTLSLLHFSKPTQSTLLPLLTSLPPFLNLNYTITQLHSALTIPLLPPSPSLKDLLSYATTSLVSNEAYNTYFSDFKPYFLSVKTTHFLEGKTSVTQLQQFLESLGSLDAKLVGEGLRERLQARLKEGRMVIEGFEKELKEINGFGDFVRRIKERVRDGVIEGYVLEEEIGEAVERKMVFLRCFEATRLQRGVKGTVWELREAIGFFQQKKYRKYVSEDMLIKLKERLKTTVFTTFKITTLIANENKIPAKKFLTQLSAYKTTLKSFGILFKNIKSLIISYQTSKKFELIILSETPGFDPHLLTPSDLSLLLPTSLTPLISPRGILPTHFNQILNTSTWQTSAQNFLAKPFTSSRATLTDLLTPPTEKCKLMPEFKKLEEIKNQLEGYDYFVALGYDKQAVRKLERGGLGVEIKVAFAAVKAGGRWWGDVNWVELYGKVKRWMEGGKEKNGEEKEAMDVLKVVMSV
jgi:hypothetical protein